MTRPNEEADRLWIMASEQRRTADYLEAQAASLRRSRTPMDHGRYFRLLAERDYRKRHGPGPPDDGWLDDVSCSYCPRLVHPFDPTHRISPVHAHDGRCLDANGEQVPERCANIDHRIPVSRGGTNDLDNLVIACRQCNHRKGATTDSEFRLLLAIESLDHSVPDVESPNVDIVLTSMAFDCVGLLDRTLPPQYVQPVIDWFMGRIRLAQDEAAKERFEALLVEPF